MEKSDTMKLVETHRVLNEEFSTMQNISHTLLSTSQTFENINNTYDDFGSQMSKSRSFLKEIQQRITLQDVVFYICFYIYLATCAWLVLKRFGLTLVVEFLLTQAIYVVQYLQKIVLGEL